MLGRMWKGGTWQRGWGGNWVGGGLLCGRG